jgi:hypothetical protein
MTIPREQVRVKIGAMSLVLPVHIDINTTNKIVQEVEDRLKRIEEESETVDTQRFAVQAAYEFAGMLHDLQNEHREDTRELIKALEQLVTQLKELSRRFHLDISPSDQDR